VQAVLALISKFENCEITVRNSAGLRRGARAHGPFQSGPPTMFMFLTIRATSLCHLDIFSEECFFADPIRYRSARW